MAEGAQCEGYPRRRAVRSRLGYATRGAWRRRILAALQACRRNRFVNQRTRSGSELFRNTACTRPAITGAARSRRNCMQDHQIGRSHARLMMVCSTDGRQGRRGRARVETLDKHAAVRIYLGRGRGGSGTCGYARAGQSAIGAVPLAP